MKPICRKRSKGARRERRLGAYCGAIGDVPRAASLPNDARVALQLL